MRYVSRQPRRAFAAEMSLYRVGRRPPSGVETRRAEADDIAAYSLCYQDDEYRVTTGATTGSPPRGAYLTCRRRRPWPARKSRDTAYLRSSAGIYRPPRHFISDSAPARAFITRPPGIAISLPALALNTRPTRESIQRAIDEPEDGRLPTMGACRHAATAASRMIAIAKGDT